MPRFIVTIRKPHEPTCYYLSSRGLRCYNAVNVAVFRTLAEAQEQREYFAKQMPLFVLTIEQLPANVRNVSRAILSAVPI